MSIFRSSDGIPKIFFNIKYELDRASVIFFSRGSFCKLRAEFEGEGKDIF